MNKLLQEFNAYLEEQVSNHSIYTWGAQGQGAPTITEAWIDRRETSPANAARAIAYWKKQVAAGYGDKLRAFDCSGLGMYWLQNLQKIVSGDMSSNTMMGKCKKLSRAELKCGDWVFRVYTSGDDKGKAYHIGYVVDDALNVIEAMGRDVGVVKRPLGASGASYWNAYGRPEYFAQDSSPAPPPPSKPYHAICSGGSVYVRAGRGTQHGIFGTAYKDDKLLALPEKDGWCEVAAELDGHLQVGFMSGKYVDEV